MSDDSGGFSAPPPPPPPPSAGGGGTLPARGLGDILSAAFDVYKANAAKLIGIVAIVVVPLSLIGALLTKLAFKANCSTVQQWLRPMGRSANRGASPSYGSLAVFGIALAFIMSFVVQAAIARAAGEATVGDPVDANESYRWGFQHLGNVLWISILSFLFDPGRSDPVHHPRHHHRDLPDGRDPCLLFENKRGAEALGRSWNLVKGHFWHVLGVVIVTGLITGIVSGIFNALGGSNWFLYWIMDSHRPDHHRAVLRARLGDPVPRPACPRRVADRRPGAPGAGLQPVTVAGSAAHRRAPRWGARRRPDRVCRRTFTEPPSRGLRSPATGSVWWRHGAMIQERRDGGAPRGLGRAPLLRPPRHRRRGHPRPVDVLRPAR